MKILGISGWSGSGKTTLITALIPELKSRGYTVSTLKHAHHKFDIDKPGKDSYRHREAGAKEVLVSSHARWALLHENSHQPEAAFSDLTQKFEPVDILLVEGFKTENFPKLEVWRGLENATPLYQTDPTVIGVITNLPKLDTDLPLLDIDNINEVSDFIEKNLFAKTNQSSSAAIANDCYQSPAEMISVSDARERILKQTLSSAASESIEINEATGRILAKDIVSGISLPPADNSAVDGFAFSGELLQKHPNHRYSIVGRSAAGTPFTGQVLASECVKIFTGALIPDGCDTVAMIEDCSVDGTQVHINKIISTGSNCRKAAEDIGAGDLAVKQGVRLEPQHIARLTSIGVSQLDVFKKLRVGIVSTGDEILEPGSPHQHGKIFDANRYMLRSCLEKCGYETRDYGIVEDHHDSIRDVFKKASDDCDFVISSGGVSMGDEDHVKAVVEELGSLSFWRIAIKPGRPLALGNMGSTPFMGLPGNPVAALVCMLQFALPLARKLSGVEYISEPKTFLVPSAFEMNKKLGRKEWLRAAYVTDEQGFPAVQKFRSEGSGLIESLTWADGLIELDEETPHVKIGDPLKFIPFSEFYS